MAIINMVRMLRAMMGAGGIEGFRDDAEAIAMQMGELIPPGKHAVKRLNTAPPGRGVNKMIAKMPLGEKVKLLPTLLRTMNAVSQCAEYMKDALAPTQHTADNAFLDTLKTIAKAHGAVDLGFVRIGQDEVFEGYAIPYQNALIFTMEMDKAAIATAPSHRALIEVLKTYGTLGQVAIALTEHLRERGYGAYPGFPVGGLVDYVRLAEQAGIGAIGYHGLLISPHDGTRQRINVVFTNMDIPEPEANPHLWVRDFCAMCHKCVRDCPPDAIYTTGEVDAVTGRKPVLDYERCLNYFADNNGCAICVKVCPFSEAGYDVIQTRFIGTRNSN